MRALVLLLWLPAIASAEADAGVTVVTGARTRLPGGTSLRGTEARATPLVEHDALKAVQTFPGVGRASPGTADLVVFGAAPGETRVEIDGIEVPSLFHAGGYRSVLSSTLVKRVELEPAPIRPDVGRGLGGVVRVETTSPAQGAHAELSSDVSDSAASVGVASDEASLAAAGRIGTLSAAVSPFLRGAAADRFAIPQSWDAQLRGAWAPTARDELVLLWLSSADALSLELSSDDPALSRGREERSDSHRVGLTWRRGDSSEATSVTAWGGLDRHAINLSTPLASALLRDDRWLGGLEARWRGSPAKGVTATCGFDGLFTSSGLERDGPLTLPPREGDVVAFGEPLSDDRAVDAFRVSGLDAAVFAGLDVSLGRLSLAPGLRLAAIASDVSRRTPVVASTPSIGLSMLDFALDPRLTVAWAPSDWLTASVVGGRSHQLAEATDRSAVFGTPELHPSHGAHLVAGVLSRPMKGLAAEVTGFFRAANGLAVRDPAVGARLAQVLLQSGEGRAMGVNVAARLTWRELAGSVTYTLGRSERRQAPDQPWRLADFDQTHVLSAAASHSWRGWHLGARARWASGLPRTPVEAGTFDVRRGVYEPVFGPRSSTRLPDFFQLDLEAGRTFTLGRWWLELSLEVFNVTNRANVEEWVYDSAFSRRGALTGLPAFGTVGVRGGF